MMRRRVLTAGLAAVFGAVLSLCAAFSEPQDKAAPLPPVRRVGNTLILVGEINSAMRAQFFAAISDNIKKVVIYSGGGQQDDAIPIGREIWRRKLTLEVSGACMSACAQYIFLAATHRVIDQDSLVGFHNTASSGLRIIGSYGNPDTRAHYVEQAAAERQYYRDLNIPEIYLYQPQIEIGTVCYRYLPYSGPAGVKAPKADLTSIARFTAWIPSKEFLEKTGIAFTGYWPADYSEMMKTFAKVFKPSASILFGGHVVPLTDRQLDAEYKRIVEDVSPTQPGAPLDIAHQFSQTCIDAAKTYLPLGVSASTPIKPPLRDRLEKIARAWLALLDRQDYDDAWQQSLFPDQAKLSQTYIEDMFHKVRDAAGPFVLRDLMSASFGTDVSGAPAMDYAILRFRSRFRNGLVDEIVNLKMRNRVWVAAGYSMYPVTKGATAH